MGNACTTAAPESPRAPVPARAGGPLPPPTAEPVLRPIEDLSLSEKGSEYIHALAELLDRVPTPSADPQPAKPSPDKSNSRDMDDPMSMATNSSKPAKGSESALPSPPTLEDLMKFQGHLEYVMKHIREKEAIWQRQNKSRSADAESPQSADTWYSYEEIGDLDSVINAVSETIKNYPSMDDDEKHRFFKENYLVLVRIRDNYRESHGWTDMFDAIKREMEELLKLLVVPDDKHRHELHQSAYDPANPPPKPVAGGSPTVASVGSLRRLASTSVQDRPELGVSFLVLTILFFVFRRVIKRSSKENEEGSPKQRQNDLEVRASLA